MEFKQEIHLLNSAMQCLDFKTDEVQVKAILGKLLNLVETLHQENVQLREENQRLKDEIARLKGEKGKPSFKASSSKGANGDSSTGGDTKSPIGEKPHKDWSKRGKLDQLEINEEKPLRYQGPLPLDAESKGYRSVVIQGIKIERHNVRYLLESFYSPSQGRTYEAALPADVEGGFSAELKAHVIYLYHECRMTEPKILQFLTGRGIVISAGEISNLLTQKQELFHAEKAQIVQAGIQSGSFAHSDDTAARVMGANQHFFVLCNGLFSAFFIRPKKTRLALLEILSQARPLGYTLNGATLAWLKDRHLPRHLLETLSAACLPQRQADWPEDLAEADFTVKLKALCPALKARYLEWILEAAAVTWYQEQHADAQIEILISDAAKQYAGLTKLNALCWVHEERHYKKLLPLFRHHQLRVKNFRGRIWAFYRKLDDYKRQPSPQAKAELEKEFDDLFSAQTGYSALDDCIANTRSRKAGLLVVLDHPEIPLHNNPAELAVREYVMKRKISIQNRSENGVRCWETFLTIKDTCRKLSVNFYDYLLDRIAKNFQMPSLASLILNRAGP